MKSVFRATTPEDEGSLITFLAQVFGTPRESPFLEPAFMRWKYWLPRADYTAPRSFVLERAGEITAHAGLWPVSLRTETETACGAHMMDWASAPSAPGSGVAIVQRLLTMFDFIYAIGGTEMTQKVLPAFGLQEVAQAWTAARPLRPFRQMLAHQSRNWKLPVRLARNLVWSRMPRRPDTHQWILAPADLNVPDTAGLSHDRAWRPNAFFRYLLKCPVAAVRVFDLQDNATTIGRVALNLAAKQARVLGVWLNQPSPGGLQAVYTLAQDAARPALEIRVSGSTDTSETAAVAAGFRVRRREPVFLARRKGNLPALPFEFQLADSNDAGFLTERPDFMT